MDNHVTEGNAHPGLQLDLSSTLERSRARSGSQAFPSLHISSSPAPSPTSSSPPLISPLGVKLPVNKARDELRKLLAHLLMRLRARPQAPSVYDELREDYARKDTHTFGVVMETVRGAVRFKAGREFPDPNAANRNSEEDHVDESEEIFSTDEAYNYMIQLRDVLIMSDRQGWQILHATDADVQRESSSLRRLRRHSTQLGQRSRSPSLGANVGTSDLLLECISILASVVSEDGRFKISSARPTRPSFGLQAICLDIAQILVKTHRHDAKVLSVIGFAVIPAFASFEPALHTRLLAFFEDGILRDVFLDHITETRTPIVAIQVDAAADDSPHIPNQQGWRQWSSPSTPTTSSFLAAVAPSQPIAVYYLSSLIPPLLAAVLEAIDPFEYDLKNIPRLHRFHKLLNTIVTMKQDAYLDVLEVIAYHGPSTRRKALAILATFWPKALGHIVVGKSLSIVNYMDTLSGHPSGLQVVSPEHHHPYAHEFIPWRFSSRSHSSALKYGVLQNYCHACSSPVIGFGLLCPFCLVLVHLNCYDTPDGTFHGQYHPSSNADPQPFFLSFSATLPSRKTSGPRYIVKAEHRFRRANLFTLSLCLVCHKPLWGYTMQGMQCVRCLQFVHSLCLPDPKEMTRCHNFSLTADRIVIDWSVLRQTFVDHYRQILLPETELVKRPYEEISIFYSILWSQLRILENGVSYRSIVVNQKDPKIIPAKDNQVDDFELHYFARLYEAYLSSGKLGKSAMLQEYDAFNHHAQSTDHSILFDWSLLTSITSMIKTPLPPEPISHSSPSNLLQVNEPDISEPSDTISHPYELVILSHMRNTLGHEFQIYSDIAAQYMLSHIRQLGFFDRIDLNNDLFDESAAVEVMCSFPLPSGLDLSTSVETLVVAIEACLGDIDITVNEYGFLLLIRRFAPTGAASEYALTRLTKIVLSWIFAEDDRLLLIARDHVAHNLALPGVRTISDASPWPSGFTNRYPTSFTAKSGGEYVFCRRQLLIRHAIPWLSSVHDLDTSLYTNCLYEHCVEVAEASNPYTVEMSLFSSSFSSKMESKLRLATGEIILRSIIKVAQANAAFSSFPSILIRWFDFVTLPSALSAAPVYRSLPRLFSRESDQSRRNSAVNEAPLSLPDPVQIDPWKVFTDIAVQGLDNLERSFLWLRVMAHSVVDIPVQVVKQLFELARDFHAPLGSIVSLLESTMMLLWLKTFGGDGLDAVMVEVNVIWTDDLLFWMKSEEKDEEVQQFLRYSLVICLLVYGCERQAIRTLGLVSSEHIREVSQRRRTNARGSAAPAILEIDPRLVTVLSRYAMNGPEAICTIIAKFLHVLVSESALLESHEIDQFILVNGDALAQCAWRFYDINSQEISDIRASFLLRILVVDPQPFDALLRGFLRSDGKWQERFKAIIRLFRILLDVNSPSFGVPDRQWKVSVTDAINHFFYTLWLDDREEVRLAVDTWTQTLLPAHLRVISSCWNEYMSKSPVAERAKLASFLVQFHPHFPSWQVLSWETIVECLLDDDFAQNNGPNEDGYAAAAHLSVYGYPSPSGRKELFPQQDDPDTVSLRVSLVILALQLIADRADVDLINLLKIKLIFAKVLGFTNVNLIPTTNGQSFHVQFEDLIEVQEVSFPCINPLMRVLDASHQLTLLPSLMGITWNEQPVPGLIGDIFVDLIAKLWEKVAVTQNLPYAVLRGLLETMLLIIVKHDLNSPSLKHLDDSICKAVKTITELLTLDSSYDIRHLCLGVMLAFLQSYPVLALKILGHQVQVLTRLAASLHFNVEDSIVSQIREFLETAFMQYEVSGLFWLLSKQGRMSDDLFIMLRRVVNGPSSTQAAVRGEGLRDSIVRDTLSKVAASANDRAIPDVLHNLERYVAVCHHQSYPASLIQHIGLRLTAIARQTADFPLSLNSRATSGFDPNPLLLMSATIVQHHKVESTDLLLHTETLLRAALVRFDVSLNTLKRLLHVTSTMHQRPEINDTNGVPANHMAMGVLDVLSDTLKGKVRTQPSTLAAMLEVILAGHNNQNSYFPTSAVLRAGADAITHLVYPNYRETYGQNEFSASLAVAQLILHVSAHSDSFLTQSLVGDARNPATVRVWNLVALAALRSTESASAHKLMLLLPYFVAVYVLSLRPPISGIFSESFAPSVNHAFASVKLWMLLARRTSIQADASSIVGSDVTCSDVSERIVWNELWPPFERLMVYSLGNSADGEIHPLATFIWGCVSDLILFVRQTRSLVSLDTSSHVSILNTLRMSGNGEPSGAKFARAQRSISEPPVDIPFDTLVNLVATDVLTAEKLQSLETYRQGGYEKRREYTERGRVGGHLRNPTQL